jgi:hypothetical protein
LVAVAVAALVVYGIYRLADLAIKSALPLPDSTLTGGMDRWDASGMLAVDLAKTAAEALRRDAARNAYLVDGYVQLRCTDPSQSPAEARPEVPERLLRWYNEEVASADYSSLGLDGLDALLEVGIDLYDYDAHGRLTKLGVMVRLVDPATKQVLGRAKDSRTTDFRAAKPELPKQRDKAVGRELVTQCLKKLGLFAE